jgi:hypothetical protein
MFYYQDISVGKRILSIYSYNGNVTYSELITEDGVSYFVGVEDDKNISVNFINVAADEGKEAISKLDLVYSNCPGSPSPEEDVKAYEQRQIEYENLVKRQQEEQEREAYERQR